MGPTIEEIGFVSIIALFATFVGVLAGLLGLLLLSWKQKNAFERGSPYSKEPLIYGGDIAKTLERFINDFLKSQPEPDNPPIDMQKTVICRGTGRVFADAVLVKGSRLQVRLDWGFIERRFEGSYVSWGSLSEFEQSKLKLLHGGDLEGYQIENSSKRLRPQDVEEYFKQLAPGPLYVDKLKGTLLGWKKVPGTDFEVLVVQRPKFKTIDESL